MKKILIIGSLIAVVILALAAFGYAYAQRQLPPNGTPIGPGGMMGQYGDFGPGGMMGGRGNGNPSGMMGQRGGYGPGGMMGGGFGPMHEYVEEAFAEAVGLSVEEVEERLSNGESFYDIAIAQGIPEDGIADLMTQVHQAAFDRMVEEGVLTQEQADWMLQHMDGRWEGGFGPGGMMGGRGRGGFGPGGMGFGEYGPVREYVVAGFAEAFGLTVDDLQARLDAGETLYDVAVSQGQTDEQFTDLRTQVRTDAIAQAVTDGVITQEQADWMLNHMQNGRGNGFGPGFGGCPMHGGSAPESSQP